MNAAELAQAALSSEPLTHALLLSEWIGSGRELTSSGVLRPALAREACEALGIGLPDGKLRSAKDVPDLQLPWEVAIAAGLIEVTQKRARAASDVDVLLGAAEGASPLPPDLAERASSAWLQGVGVSMGFPDDVCTVCVTVLHELSLATRPTETGTLVEAVLESEGVTGDGEGSSPLGGPGGPSGGGGPGGGGPGGSPGVDRVAAEDLATHVEGTIAVLARFDAAFTGPGRTTGGTVTLTPHGRLLATSVLDALTPPADADAAEIVGAVGGLPAKIMEVVTADWAAVRTPAGAVRELLACAEADPVLRLPALELAQAQGTEGLSAWREAAARPGFGAYARHFLAGLGENVPADVRDAPWLLADTLAMAAAQMPSPFARFALLLGLEQLAGDKTPVVLDDLRTCGHPEGPEIADLIESGAPAGLGGTGALARGGAGGVGDSGVVDDSGGVGDSGVVDSADLLGGAGARGVPDPAGVLASLGLAGPGSGAGERASRRRRPESEVPEDWLLRLKITLRGISRPPVWRRVLVPASMSLDQLHEVIARAMGWHGGHTHCFDDDGFEYGPVTDSAGLGMSLDLGLEFEDETQTQVRDVLQSEGERLTYTYDFGDDWVHTVKLERLLPPGDVPTAVPVCLAGNGACPPENCGGSAGYTDLKYVLADPGHEDHESLLKWLGLTDASDFDAAAFSPDEATARLRHLRA